jgi:hypothetical protein
MVKHRKIAVIGVCLSALSLTCVRGDQTTVSFDSGSQIVFDQGSTPLSGGTTADGDGFVLQLGYFTGANFTGTFIPLSGEGSANTGIIPGSVPAEQYNKTSIGDLNVNGAGNGTFALSLDFIAGDLLTGNNLPANGTQLAIRFYNGTTMASSTFYNTVTDSLWVWKSPATPPASVTLSLNDASLVWESIVRGQAASTAFHTTISAIPEPSTYALMCLGALGMMVLRRRVKK